MKKKLVMRVASFALCAVFTGMLFGAPKSKAVVTETAIGTAAVASYFQATGLTMAASAGSTGALITTGVADIAGSYAMATGAASSGSAFLSSLAAGVSISPAGALVLTAAAVVAIGALVAWYVSENGLEEDGSTVTVVQGTSDTYLYNGVELPVLPEWDTEIYPYGVVIQNTAQNYTELICLTGRPYFYSGGCCRVSGPCSFLIYGLSDGSWSVFSPINTHDFDFAKNSGDVLLWTNTDILDARGSVYFPSVDPVASDVQNQLEITRSPDFAQPDTELDVESEEQMVFDLGFFPGITLDSVVEEVPNLIAAGTLAPTYEITSIEIGEGTDPGPDTDDEAVYPYFPVLSGIRDRLDNLGDSIVDGIMDGLASLFVPSEAYLEALPQQITDTFEERTGFLTYPFSLLPEFVDRLSDTSSDWILSWPQIVEPFTNTVLFQRGSFNVSSFIRSDAELKMLYELYQLIAKVLMSFGFLGLCYNKYCSVIGDRYGGP